ncbi:GntR family transcriptional regulator [Sphaerisporangium dianthi]|uniref:GntR family transcriptional regulator n=1 Tax=Sphaerisporangium dianthi TaxID=1436120 RepID=A0ABV9CUS2_9ACTN
MTSEIDDLLKGEVAPARRGVLTDDVYESLKGLVMDGRLAPGARVNVYAVARLLDVSQTPVREVLARLESEGLVTKEPLRGYFIAPVLDRAQVADLYDLRSLLEPWAAAMAAERAGASGAERLRAEVAGLPDAPEGTTYRQYRTIQRHDARFHDLVAELSGSPSVREALARTHGHLHLFRLDYPGRDSGEPALQEHRRIAEAVTAGRPEAAEAAMRDHLTSARERFLSA